MSVEGRPITVDYEGYNDGIRHHILEAFERGGGAYDPEDPSWGREVIAQVSHGETWDPNTFSAAQAALAQSGAELAVYEGVLFIRGLISSN